MLSRLRSVAPVLPVIALVAILAVPLVHQVEHGREHHRRALEVAEQTEHVHSDAEAFSRALENVAHHLALCFVCSTHLQMVPAEAARRSVLIPLAGRPDEGSAAQRPAFPPRRAARAPPLTV